jgi:hypothetical protein
MLANHQTNTWLIVFDRFFQHSDSFDNQTLDFQHSTSQVQGIHPMLECEQPSSTRSIRHTDVCPSYKLRAIRNLLGCCCLHVLPSKLIHLSALQTRLPLLNTPSSLHVC